MRFPNPHSPLLILTVTACLLLLCMRLFVPASASPEYIYTVEQLARFLLPALLLAVFWLASRGMGLWTRLFWLAGIILAAIPVISPPVVELPWRIGYALSVCWTGAFCALGMAFFCASAGRGAIASGLLCTAGSVLLALGAAELYLLCTPQAQDAIVNGTAWSRHLGPGIGKYGDNMAGGPRGDFPMGTGARVREASRLLKHDLELFDVLYGFDARGRRAVPEFSGQPEAELYLFGCSFTFGVGLNDHETWAWQLAERLGPKWRLANYAYAGFGPQQMLSLLEDKAIEQPAAPKRFALYFAIEDQLRRNAGLMYKPSVRYALDDRGQLRRAGMTTDSAYTCLCLLPRYFNGSQLARFVALGATLAIAGKNHDLLARTYLAIIQKAALLLRQDYDARLTVLLWPDVEYLAEPLRQAGIPVLYARSYLPGWEDEGPELYLIHPRWEWHPNARAASRLATGLEEYFTEQAGG